MLTARDVRFDRISPVDGNRVIRALHYSRTVVRNSQVHFGAFVGNRCMGAASFGPPLDRSKVLGLVRGTPWTGMLELNRLALSDRLPRNTESRMLGWMLRWFRRNAPQVKWVLSFADGTQCGDGTIYRAAGFPLTGIRPSKNLARTTSGRVIHKLSLEDRPAKARDILGSRSYFDVTGGRYDFRGCAETMGWEILKGFQLRYIGFVDPSWRSRLAIPEIPYSRIAEVGAGMYRGIKRTKQSIAASGDQPGEGGAIPTRALHFARVGSSG